MEELAQGFVDQICASIAFHHVILSRAFYHVHSHSMASPCQFHGNTVSFYLEYLVSGKKPVSVIFYRLVDKT